MPQWAWFAIAAAAVLLAAPNGVIVKVAMEEIPAVWVNVFRFALIALVMLPVIIRSIKVMNRQNMKYALLAGVMSAIAVTGYMHAIDLSQASYVAVINLGIPILLMLYSVYLTKERVSKRAMLGISIAALGAFIMIGTPLLVGQGFEQGFYPLATVLALINCATFPLTIIFSRKANEAGLPITATYGISASMVATVSVIAALIMGVSLPAEAIQSNPLILLPIAYSALAVSFLARVLTVAAYQRLGSVAVSGFQYIESFLSIMLPILLIGERMTTEMLVGGVMILIGVIVAEMRFHPKLHADRQAGRMHS